EQQRAVPGDIGHRRARALRRLDVHELARPRRVSQRPRVAEVDRLDVATATATAAAATTTTAAAAAATSGPAAEVAANGAALAAAAADALAAIVPTEQHGHLARL